jgi:hypothetical protein
MASQATINTLNVSIASSFCRLFGHDGPVFAGILERLFVPQQSNPSGSTGLGFLQCTTKSHFAPMREAGAKAKAPATFVTGASW